MRRHTLGPTAGSEDTPRAGHQAEAAEPVRIAGVDEVGLGPLAGPIVAVAALYDDLECPFPELINPKGPRTRPYLDSKKLTEKKREEIYDRLIDGAVSVGLGHAWPEEVDEHGAGLAHRWALRRAIEDLQVTPELVRIDGKAFKLRNLPYPQTARNHGDLMWWQVSAASIIAKVWRDRIMQDYAVQYPDYSFQTNKGYGSPYHLDQLRKLGPCPIHRRSYLTRIPMPQGVGR